MKALELVAHLETLGVSFWEEGGELRFRAPHGVMTPERRSAVRENRQAVIGHLRRRAEATAIRPDPDLRCEPFPLTDVQAAYLLGRQDVFAYGGVGSQIYVELRMEAVDPPRLERAWNRLVARHDMLRARILAEGYQQVAAEVSPYTVAVQDLRSTEPGARATAVADLRARMAHRPFTIDRWPLFELAVTLAPDHALVHFAIDFLIADFMSVQLLLSELAALYREPERELPALTLTFRDYVLADRTDRDGGPHVRDRDYWLGRLDALPPAPDLPLSPRGDTGTAGFRRLGLVLDRDSWAGLRMRAGDHCVTPTVAVLAAYAAILGRWSRGRSFSLNLTLLNRRPLHAEVEALVGDFTSVGLLAVEPPDDRTFTALARAVQDQLWRDMDHRLFSGVEVMRELARRRGQGAALMPVVFTSTIGLDETGTDLGEPVFGLSQTPQVWIDCQAIERAGTLVLQWDVRDGVLSEGVPDAMFAAMDGLLRALAAGEGAWMEATPLPLPPEQAEARRAANDTAAPAPEGPLHGGFLVWAAMAPERSAVIGDGEIVSYGALAAAAGGIARTLLDHGCAPGSLVAVALEKGWRQVAAVLGILMAGGAYLPIDTSQPVARRDRILEDAGARLALGRPDGVWPETVRVLDPATLPPAPPPPAPAGIGADTLAYVIYTSGSTGTPKGVMIAHGAALNTVVDINRILDVGSDDRVFGLASLGFDLSVYDIFGPLAAGGALVLPRADRRDDPAYWRALIEDHRVTVWNSVPAQMQMLRDVLIAERGRRSLPLTRVMLSGDWIPLGLTAWLRDHLPDVALYGLGGATEASIWSILHPIGEAPPDWPSVPYGRPLANQSFHVLDRDLRPCPDWVVGELHIGGLGLAIGYLGDAARTAERFIHHPVTGERLYRTGDLGRYRPGGLIEFLGREDSQVKIRGYRIELAEIEAALQASPGVATAAVLVEGDDPMERQLVAFAQPAPAAGSPLPVPDHQPFDAAESTAAVAFSGALDHVARLSFARAIGEAGGLPETGPWGDAETILDSVGVIPALRRLARRWLVLLAGAGFLRERGGQYESAGRPGDAEIAAAWDEVERLRALHGYGDVVPRYLALAARETVAMLRGAIAPTELFFPEGRGEFVQAAYAESLVGRRINAAVIDLVRGAARPGRGPLRVLEVGAGVGGTSAALIPALADLEVDYLFTDVSRFFLNRAAEVFADHAFVRTGLFDINADPREQGHRPNSQDVIVACNVLHNATDLPAVLRALGRLLRPGGRLVVVETVEEIAWTMASMEFMVGDDAFADQRGLSDRIFLDEAGWSALLADAAGSPTVVLPRADDPIAAVGQRVFAVCFKTDLAELDEAGLRAQLAERLPIYMVPRRLEVVDALPLTANGKVDRKALRAWVARDAGPSARESAAPADELERRLAALWGEVLGLERVGRHDDFFQIGGDSLLISQLTSRLHSRFPEAGHLLFSQTMRQILRQPTIAELAAFLRQASPLSEEELAEAAPASALTPLGDLTGDPACVLVHELGGTMAPYLHLNHALGERLPLAGLAVTKVAAYLERDPATLVDDLADEYATLLAPHPPARLVGYGLGGLLAVAVAGRLAERGVPVPALTVVGSCGAPHAVLDDLALEYAFCRFIGADPGRAGYPADDAPVRAALRAAGRGGMIADGTMAALADHPAAGPALRSLLAMPAEERLDRIAAAMVLDRADIDALGYARTHLSLFRHSLAAYAHFRPGLHAGDIQLLLPENPEPALPWLEEDVAGFWRGLCLGDLRVHAIPGGHFSCLKPPHVAAVARLVVEPVA
ncbi:amino acid adenylation domain-containing protein [Azospirillum sp. RWY-5-1]|uniref:Amino acid adenylation domain-containing protein n=1 Tax=Azospirillum oleiclasticum TaxID=2735135 RepID=A0ABX2TJE6_9PROT|nr:non-ribosomal peptide synthetase [Azospirillum oleiclasticum]NYZ14610.1 amino acid adenylation domain-containing protein [Azospirillum oleiclasticum]NYZ24388.1 amino acid adenylation domain-containing protein [Azospirillum oleiclasticum]